ncbi:MAG: hemolysin III family protein [Mycobacteriales bacterium]
MEHLAARPTWRGHLHQWAFVVSIVTGIVLVSTASGARVVTAIYACTVTLLFGTSALYHRVTWSVRMHMLMKRLDHSMIFILIAGTYTPFAVLALPRHTATILLTVVWSGAVLGIGLRMLWLRAPRWVYVPLYIALGCVALVLVPQIVHFGGVVTFVLVAAGGAAYIAGAVVYAIRRPDPLPRVFGYHEIFHACTLVAAVCHYTAVWFALY